MLRRYCNIIEKSKQVFYVFLHLTNGEDLFYALMFKYACIRHEKTIVTIHH